MRRNWTRPVNTAYPVRFFLLIVHEISLINTTEGKKNHQVGDIGEGDVPLGTWKILLYQLHGDSAIYAQITRTIYRMQLNWIFLQQFSTV